MTKTMRLHLFRYHFAIFLFIVLWTNCPSASAQLSEPLIVDHTCTDITQIPEAAIIQAKADLHIAYGHTSHGSQLADGMTGLVSFANGGGLGLSLPTDIFAWNDGGTGGALDLHDNAMSGDVGDYPGWVNNTRSYLGTPDPATGRGSSHPDVNVIIWAWCWEVYYKYDNGTMYSEYLDPMTQLEIDYPGIVFVYMTGHVDHDRHSSTTAGNQVIRDYCIANNKVLYDFADIESYDPDGKYFEFADDNCDYYESASGSLLGNWAIEWQNSHTEGVDWYDCYSSHSQALNANLKAYAAWWLWATLGGWDEHSAVQITNFAGRALDSSVQLTWAIASDEEIKGFKIYRRTEGQTRNRLVNSNGLVPVGDREYVDEDVLGGEVYIYTLSVVREDGSELRSLTITVKTTALTPVLYQNYPNPFNPITKIDYQIPKESRVILKIYSVRGEEITTLVNGVKAEGFYSTYWDGKDAAGTRVSSGVYIYRLESDHHINQTRKMIMLR